MTERKYIDEITEMLKTVDKIGLRILKARIGVLLIDIEEKEKAERRLNDDRIGF